MPTSAVLAEKEGKVTFGEGFAFGVCLMTLIAWALWGAAFSRKPEENKAAVVTSVCLISGVVLILTAFVLENVAISWK